MKSSRREWISGVTSGSISETSGDLCIGVFFDVFGGGPFFAPGPHWDAHCGEKGAKWEPKVMKKKIRTRLLEHAKTMAGTVRETYGVVPGRARATLFSERGAKTSTEGSREGSRRIFHDFRCPLGCPWDTILEEQKVFYNDAEF